MVNNEPLGAPRLVRQRTAAPPVSAPRQDGAENRAEFGECYRAEITRLVGFLMAAGADADEAWDAAQTAFARAWEQWSSIHTNPRAWLRTTSYRVFLRQVPDRESRRGRAAPDKPDVALTPEQMAQLAQSTAAVRELLGGLPYAQRVALALRMDGFSYDDIAEITDKTEAAARQNVSRAKAALRARLTVAEGGTR